MVAVASEAAGDERLRFARGTAERLPAGDARYDLVVSTTSFDHWQDQAAGLVSPEWHRLYAVIIQTVIAGR